MVQVAWVPGWYEQDPKLEVRIGGKFAFWRVVPDHLCGPEALVLYNTLWQPEYTVVASGLISSIRHSELGQVQRADTRGLDYTIALTDGTELLVNAEEEPGRLYERGEGGWVVSRRVVSNWRFVVEFESLSQPSSTSL